MSYYNRIRNFLSSLYFIGLMLIAVSCSEWPSPGPISPSHSTDTPSLSEQGKSHAVKGKVKPVSRRNGNAAYSNGFSLAKSDGEEDDDDDDEDDDEDDEAYDCRGTTKTQVIRKSGGSIWHCGHSIRVPRRAVSENTEFSITISANDYITVEFGPDGWFNKEVTVTISYNNADLTGIDPLNLTLAWYDETSGEWIDLGGKVDLKKKTVSAKAWHFTKYTLSAR